MSSTNRGKARNTADYYVTPVEAVLDFIAALRADLPKWTPRLVLDPCAGGDPKHEMSYPLALGKVWSDVEIATVDIREDSLAQYCGDYLACDIAQDILDKAGRPFAPDLVMSNPPFCLAMEFLQKALLDVAKEGYVVMLLRLNYFGTQKRRDWWKGHMPLLTYVHSERMGFTDDGKTDSIEYMHCVWQKDNFPAKTRLSVI